MFTTHKIVGFTLFRVSNKVKRIGQSLKGIAAASRYLGCSEINKAHKELGADLAEVQEWVNWAVAHLAWLEELDSNEISEDFDLENPPERPSGYLW